MPSALSILHLEFQTKNNVEMLARMQEYHGLIYRRYKMPIRHIVVYLGKKKSTMKSVLKSNLVFTGFDIVNITEINPQDLIREQIPEVVVMALLGDFKSEEVEKILIAVIKRLKELTDSDERLNKYINQLLILARMRNLENIISEKLKTMDISYDVEKDGLYIQGIEKGIEKGLAKAAWKMHEAGNSVKIISNTLDLTVAQVKASIKEWEEKS